MESKKIITDLLNRYEIKDMADWKGVDADLIVTDPPFGIRFNGKNSNYHRNVDNVVGGYVEWKVNDYRNKMDKLLKCIALNLKPDGEALIFSGWNNSNIIYAAISNSDVFKLNGKLYWTYNFAPASSRRPSHNVYEIFWIVKGKKWTYNNRCFTNHCRAGEPNLAALNFKRDYKVNMPKYATRLPFKLLECLLEHFSAEGDLIFDPLGGSGMVGIVAHILKRNFVVGDLNKNGKVVFAHLLDHYLNKGGLTQNNKLIPLLANENTI